MKRLFLIGAAAVALTGIAATSAGAVVTTGVINITGHVPAQCSVITAGTPPSGDFGNSVNLGNLADANGHLLSALAGSTNSLGTQSFQVSCTGAGNQITLKATPLATNPVVAAPAGYANTINYTAEADYSVVGGTSPVVQSHTSDSSTSTTSFDSGVRLANTAGNIVIKAYSFNTSNTATDILVASTNYAATITVTIDPGA